MRSSFKKRTRSKARFFDINTHAPINISHHYSGLMKISNITRRYFYAR
ncbi:hypothetical protein HMPREF1565_0984 [Providencia alcalifaciens RIMD 1656011]|uniref:Uncharacterized protein n=1 Tax=Providencia alcalifaciens 205/92 TaxID=1256988 RepID=A0AAV3M7B1_9GAMM|nr:hypothetical protein HMPREF1565_0984 [Providencia alcalifaciens RIMD 1656011]EUD11664.1 hypothetical protein HMPREF1563_0350 [Providencia alcalifaciens 205/92]